MRKSIPSLRRLLRTFSTTTVGASSGVPDTCCTSGRSAGHTASSPLVHFAAYTRDMAPCNRRPDSDTVWGQGENANSQQQRRTHR